MPLMATERDVFEFFSRAGKLRDVKLIMDRNSRRSKGVGYIEFYDAMSVSMAIALSGHLFLGQPVMVKPSEAEKNLVQSTASAGGAGVAGPYGATDRKLYVGNLHFNMNEFQLRQAARSLNRKLEIAGRTIKVSSVTDHVGAQDSGTKTADFDDDDGESASAGQLCVVSLSALNAQSRAMLMAKLDRSSIAPSVGRTLRVPSLNGAILHKQSLCLSINYSPSDSSSSCTEPIGVSSECLLLKNMFDPAIEEYPELDLDIRDDVQEEFSKYGRVKYIYVDNNLECGHHLFDEMPNRDVVFIASEKVGLGYDVSVANTWISGYAKCDDLCSAEMVFKGIASDSLTVVP
ncbi:hypothetical protein BUALT_Bualt11G0005700 [Buddleja alternifolia]|uniref:RRM domain-containing protein n=1 Tax=Buddleja alternifolia TaxID=168488 RepID=A0AAV6WSU7_9LAMI|nr:hypothetical protein BUALT_Bualt11G0005700 [Buddleja alternifolia]